MSIESMCAVCHGPIPRKKRRGVGAVVCESGNCHTYWHHSLKRGKPLSPKYQHIRALHAYRREMLAMEVFVLLGLDAGGYLLVG